MYIIGLTGNIASGKSEVLNMLRKLGAATVDADKVVHRLLARGTDVWRAVVDEFGREVVLESGEIDRRRLAALVFTDAGALARLEAIVHPAVGREIDGCLRAVQAPVAVIDAIKLLESSLASRCDAIWVVTCAPEQQVARLVAHRGMSEEEALMRTDAQPPASEKVARANVVIDNSGTLTQTRSQVRQAWKRTVEPAITSAP